MHPESLKVGFQGKPLEENSEYELAKVQEAKETPSVKVLDPAKIPEWKSSPPRLVIMLLGTFFVFGFSLVWVLGSARWKGIDPQDPRKVLLQEVAGTLKARISWAHSNGVSPNGAGARADAGAAGCATGGVEGDFLRDNDLKDK